MDKGFVVVMGAALGNKMSNDGRETQLHKSNGVYHVLASTLLKFCPLEDKDPRCEAAPLGALSEAANPWTRRLPYQPTDDEITYHSEPGVHTV